MDDLRKRFKSCGTDVSIAPDVTIEHPECIEVGDRVRLMHNVHWIGRPKVCRIGSDVTFYPGAFIQGDAERFIVGDRVTFYPGVYISLGEGPASCVEIGHHSHFAPRAVLYGWGGLRLGAYCNIAAHTVFATVGHDPRMQDRPMALVPGKIGPITLEEDIWVAANCTIAANTRIARGCVIGANSVVTRDTEPYGIYMGAPARRKRDRPRD